MHTILEENTAKVKPQAGACTVCVLSRQHILQWWHHHTYLCVNVWPDLSYSILRFSSPVPAMGVFWGPLRNSPAVAEPV